MRGQGSPSPRRRSRQPRAPRRARPVLLFALAWIVVECLGPSAASSAFSAEQQLRIRIAWGGGTPRPWVGSVSVSQGIVRQITLLGVEGDDPGSVWLERGSAWIQQRSPRSYSAIDVYISLPHPASGGRQPSD